MFANGGRAPKVRARHTVAVYDPADGRVVHMHHVVMFEGGKEITSQQAEREAIEKATRRGHDAGRLKTLLSRDDAAHHGGRFRVDLKAGKMVALEAPPRPAR